VNTLEPLKVPAGRPNEPMDPATGPLERPVASLTTEGTDNQITDPAVWREARVREQLAQARADALARFGVRRERNAALVARTPPPNIVVAAPAVPPAVATTSKVVARLDRPSVPAVSDEWVLGCIQAAMEAPVRVARADREHDRALATGPTPLALPVARRTADDVPDPLRNHTGSRPEPVASKPSAERHLAEKPVIGDVVDLREPAPEPTLEDAAEEPAAPMSVVSGGAGHRTPATRAGRIATLTRRTVKTLVGAVIAVLFLSQGALGILPVRTSYILTGSMSPTMPVGSLVVSRQVSAVDVHPGDVITFPDPAKPGIEATHRVYATEPSARGPVIVTKGDANAIPDPWRLPQQGKMWVRVASVRSLGYPLGWLQAPVAHLVASLLPAFALAGWILIWVWKPVLKRVEQTRTASSY
jgi:signal peptidase